MDLRQIQLIGAALGHGAQNSQTEHGPSEIKEHLLKQCEKHQLTVQWAETVVASMHDSESDAHGAAAIVAFNQSLKKVVSKQMDLGFPVVIGGDHAIAMGTWPGVIEALDARRQFGLIWLDAHMDAHTPSTSPSNALHGMPVAGLLGHGKKAWHELLSEGAYIQPEDIVLIGIRSYEPGEAKLLSDLGVRVVYMDEVLKRGFAAVLEEALTQVTARTKAFGLTIDLDGFDPQYAPGVGSPAKDGLNPDEVIPALKSLTAHPQYTALEIAEYNPDEDIDSRTRDLSCRLIIELTPKGTI